MQVSFATLREEISTDFYCQDNSPNKKMSSYPSIHQFGFGSWCLLTQRKEILSRLCPIKKCATRWETRASPSSSGKFLNGFHDIFMIFTWVYRSRMQTLHSTSHEPVNCRNFVLAGSLFIFSDITGYKNSGLLEATWITNKMRSKTLYD